MMNDAKNRLKVIIMGAAGRDFHNFNVLFRDDPNYEVVAFTAAQIPAIDGRKYPPVLAGSYYPEGIPIYPESQLAELIREQKVDLVVFAYSDIAHLELMHKASEVLALGANFMLVSPTQTQLRSSKPVISIGAVRTGAGKSPTTRKVCKILSRLNKKYVVVRHPMPYGNLSEQVVQKFTTVEDLDKYNCTIEEREEYEPHLKAGSIVFAGVDYAKILREAESIADVIVWDGGNNDLPFFKPDLHIVVTDPLRVGHELSYYPGETNLRLADIVIINKVDSANPSDVEKLRRNIRTVNPTAKIIDCACPLLLPDNAVDNATALIRNSRVLVVEDGPTITHGEMVEGAGMKAARLYGAAEIIDARDYAKGSIIDTYNTYKHIGNVLPAMGYSEKQRWELEATINEADCDVIVSGTPVDIRKVLKLNKPVVQVRYEIVELTRPGLTEFISEVIETQCYQ